MLLGQPGKWVPIPLHVPGQPRGECDLGDSAALWVSFGSGLEMGVGGEGRTVLVPPLIEGGEEVRVLTGLKPSPGLCRRAREH